MNVAINIVTALCFILLTGTLVYFIANFFATKSRRGRIAFIRSFKKGKCLAVLLISLPLFFIGYLDKGVSVIDSILSAITQLVDLVILKFNVDKVQTLMDKNTFYKVTVYYCCILVTVNAFMFALSVMSQGVSHLVKSAGFTLSKKSKTYIFGFNKNNLDIYKSNKDKNCKCSIVGDLSKADCSELYVEKVNYIAVDDKKYLVDKIIRQLKSKRFKNKIVVVINTGDNEKNLEITRLFSVILQEETKKINPIESQYQNFLFDRISIHFFCDPKYEAISHQIVGASCGCIHYINKYQMIAMNFIEKYPFASFMGKYINKETALVDNNVNINVCMIGFGDTNRQIFLTSVANNQFLTQADTNPDGVELKQVNYHIFDKEPKENDKNLNHSYNRYQNECLSRNKPEEYLPLPKKPAEKEYHNLDVNAVEFYNEIRNAFENKKDAKKSDENQDVQPIENQEKDTPKVNVNFAIIAYSTDLENIDMAHKLVEKRKEWGLDNLVIFVKARKSYKDDAIFNGKDVILIGNEKDDVYNLEEITGDDVFRMARMRNLVYRLEYAVKDKGEGFAVTDEFVKKTEEEVDKKWFVDMSQWERDSSLYCCLSLRSKLNLMGLDYRVKSNSDKSAMSEEQYLASYAKGDMPDTHTYKAKVRGKSIVNYTLNFPPSLRKNLAILEHLRWNSFMISRGFIPATKEQILNESGNGKDYSLRRHGNITTFEGLREFRSMVANKTGKEELDVDVIRYDYQILDDAYWLLDQVGYEIFEKEKQAKE